MRIFTTKVLGAIFLSMAILAIWASYGMFTNQFADWEKVTLQSSKLGLQLPQRADVKVRGVIVGEVLDFTPNADGAELTLGLFEDQIDKIPANVTGRIDPKTLFGEKYVSLVIPEEPSSTSLRAGDRISRTEVAIEVEEVLADVHPLLETVQPADLSRTLNALATALEGRGDQIGETLETLDGYLQKINPQIRPLVEDLRLTAQVSDLYDDVLPEVAQILRNTIVTTGTLEDREQQLNALFTDVSAFSGTARGFLADNRDNLIRVGQLGDQQLQVLEKYAPVFPCLLGGIVGAGGLQAEAFRGYVLHINLELIPTQPRGYDAGDRPRYGANTGPECGTLPNPPWTQDNPYPFPGDFDDGIDRPTGKGTMRAPALDAAPAPEGAAALDSQAGFVGSDAEEELMRSFLAPTLGVTTEEVPDLGVLLMAPMARGAEVSLR